MLPARVRDTIRGMRYRRVDRLVHALRDPRVSDASIAENARLVGEAGWLLDPEACASVEVVRRETEARRYARVCVWDGECEAEATTDDGLCAAHAEEQAREEAETRALIEQGEIASEDAG